MVTRTSHIIFNATAAEYETSLVVTVVLVCLADYNTMCLTAGRVCADHPLQPLFPYTLPHSVGGFNVSNSPFS